MLRLKKNKFLKIKNKLLLMQFQM